MINTQIGERDFSATTSNNFWRAGPTSIKAVTAKLALAIGEKDGGSLLRQAMALRLDAERNPAEVQEFLPEALAKDPTLRRVVERAQRLTPGELDVLQTVSRYEMARGALADG